MVRIISFIGSLGLCFVLFISCPPPSENNGHAGNNVHDDGTTKGGRVEHEGSYSQPIASNNPTISVTDKVPKIPVLIPS